MQAILTTYQGPTNTRGARITARCDAKRKTYSWDDGLDVGGNHRAAALALATELGWGTASQWVSGTLPTMQGAHVFNG